MSDSGERRYERGPEDRGEPRETHHRQTIDYTSPLWRLLGVISFFGAITALGFYLEVVGLGREFSTVATIAAIFSLGFWADKRPDRLQQRAGPFWRIAVAIKESREDIRAYTYARPLRVAVTLSVVYGVAIVVIQSAILALLTAIYSWHIAVAAGALIGAIVVAPTFFRDIWKRVAEGPSDFAEYHRARAREREEDEEGNDEEEEDYEEDDARNRRESGE